MVSGRDEFRRNWPTVFAAFVGIALGIASVPFYILGPHRLQPGFADAVGEADAIDLIDPTRHHPVPIRQASRASPACCRRHARLRAA